MLRPGALGDTLLAVPALRALRSAFPDLAVSLAAQGPAAALLQAAGEVAEGFAFDHPRITALYSGVPHPWWSNSPPSLAVAWLTDQGGAMEERLRAAGSSRVLVAPSRPTEREDQHCAEYLVRSLAPIGVGPSGDDAPLRLPNPAEASRTVYLHPGSGSPLKNWPPDRFAAVAARLTTLGHPVCLIVGEADTHAAAAVEQAYGGALPRLEGIALPALAAQLASGSAYLGNDSGVSHLAGLLGVPTMAFFGPTSPARWHPLGPRVTILPFATEPRDVVRALLAGGRKDHPGSAR